MNIEILKALRKAIHIDFRQPLIAGKNFLNFMSDYQKFIKHNNLAIEWPIKPNYPCLLDKGVSGGSANGHYFHQDLHVSQRIFELKPERHIDVGSRVDGFVAHVASFRSIEVLDIRPISTSGSRGITFFQADLMSLPIHLQASTDSISCLHALEHFGLGRYGDSIDPEGYIKGFNNLVSMLIPSGRLHLSVPVGRQRIEFNAHRIFNPETIIKLSEPTLNCVMFSYVDDYGNFHYNKGTSPQILEEVGKMCYGCGIFEFIKK